MSESLEYISIDPRAYFFIRNAAIRNVYDAMTELITNSIDAYGKRSDSPHKHIYISLDYDMKSLVMTDHAIGLSGEDMERCFMQVGAYTSTKESRGIFSRGAKDVSALGDVTYTSIKDGKISQVIITSVGKTAMYFKDRDVTAIYREKYQIPENGMHVRLYINHYIYRPGYEELIHNLSQNAQLRDILASSDVSVHLKYITSSRSSDNTEKNERVEKNTIIQYKFPKKEKRLIRMKYYVPGYDNVIATFELYMAEEKLSDYSDDNLSDYGILLTDSTSIYENSLLHSTFRNNPYMQRIYGRITCDYIHQLMLDIEENHNSKNPHPIVDPSRINGISRKHPFTKAMLSVPIKRLIVVLDDIENELSDDNNIPDLNDILDELKNMGDEIFKDLDISTRIMTERKDTIYAAVDKVQQYVLEEDEELPYSDKNIKKKYDKIQQTEETDVTPSFQIQFSKEEMKNRYLMYNRGPVFTIMISLLNPIVSQLIKYDAETDTYSGFGRKETRLLLADILLEAFTNKIIETRLVNQDEDMDAYYKYKTMYYEVYDQIDQKVTHTLLKLKYV